MSSAHHLDAPLWAVNGSYLLARPGVEFISRRLFDVEVTGRENVPRRGPVVMAANHLSFVDPVMVSMAARRNVRFMAVGFLFNQSKQFDRLMTFYGAFPVARDVLPIRAVRRALCELERGEVVGVFPEAKRVEYWGEAPPSRGAAWLAMATGAPLLPVAMQGTQNTLSLVEKRFRPAPIRVWIEKPIHPLDYTNHADPTRAMMDDWYQAMDDRLRPWWRDREDEPTGPWSRRRESNP